MASLVFEKLKQPVFNLFYIMTEGVQVEAGFTAYRKTVFLLFIDVLQVLRVMCSLRYGWTEDTQGVIEKTDLVYMFTTLVGHVISVEAHSEIFLLCPRSSPGFSRASGQLLRCQAVPGWACAKALASEGASPALLLADVNHGPFFCT
eukprot:3795138-Rhodomonas_salina.2